LTLANDVSLQYVAEALPPFSTGADISAVVSNAFSLALERTINLLNHSAAAAAYHSDNNVIKLESWEVSHFIDSLDEDDPRLSITVLQHDLLEAAKSHKSSISAEALDHYEKLANSLGDKV
jgi:SpoVK/Ycf46/Vps4 family AAA+-type ATPase